MVVKVDGAPMESMDLMRWVSRNSSRKVGTCFQDIIDLRWVRAPKLVFWYDVLCEDHPLKEMFLELFNIASSRNTFVVDHLVFSNGSLSGLSILLK
jgi:hypothetical protein